MHRWTCAFLAWVIKDLRDRSKNVFDILLKTNKHEQIKGGCILATGYGIHKIPFMELTLYQEKEKVNSDYQSLYPHRWSMKRRHVKKIDKKCC